MRVRNKIYVLAAMGFPLARSTDAATYVWQVATGEAAWSNSANWSPSTSFPSQAGDVADFSNTSLSGNVTVDVDQPLTIGSLSLGDTNKAYPAQSLMYTVQSTNGGSLTFADPSGSSTISETNFGIPLAVDDGSHTISANIYLADSLTISAATTSLGPGNPVSLYLTSKIADAPGAGSHQITFTGSTNYSVVQLSGASSFTDPVLVTSGITLVTANGLGNTTGVTVAGGTLAFAANNTTNLNVPIALGAGSTLEGFPQLVGGTSNYQTNTITNPIILSGAATLSEGSLQQLNDNPTFTGPITGTSSDLTVDAVTVSGLLSLGTGNLICGSSSIGATITSPNATFGNLIGSLHTLTISGGAKFGDIDGGYVAITAPSTFKSVNCGGQTISLNDCTFGDVNLSGGVLFVTSDGIVPSTFGNINSTGGSMAISAPASFGDLVNTGTGRITLTGAVSTPSIINSGSGEILLVGTPLASSINVSSGSLQVGNNGSAGALPSTGVSLTGNATLVFDRTGSITSTVPASGAVSISLIGTGTVTLTGSTSCTGGTNVSAGTLILTNAGAAGTGPIRLNAGGTFVTTSQSELSSNQIVFNGGNLQVDGYTNTLAFPNTPKLLVSAANGSVGTLAGSISGTSSFNETGAGIITLTGTDTFTGVTNVASGSLNVMTSLPSTSGVSMANVLTELGGNGSVNGPVMIGGGGAILSPGDLTVANSIGTLSVGPTTLNYGSEYNADLGVGGLSSLLNVNGEFNIFPFSELELDYVGLTPGVTSYTLVNYSALSGQFQYVVNQPPGYALQYGATSLRLVSVPEPACLGPLLAATTSLLSRRRRRSLP